jgi:hypothetical protein
MTKNCLNALMVIRNYRIKRRDGATTAKRFYGSAFPDFFG